MEKLKLSLTLIKKTLEIKSEIIYTDSFKKGTPVHVDYGIFSDNWDLLYAFRTSEGGRVVLNGSNSVKALIKNINLLPGKYYINVAYYKKINSNPMHWKRQAAMFVIPYNKSISEYNYTGYVYYDHEWSFE